MKYPLFKLQEAHSYSKYENNRTFIIRNLVFSRPYFNTSDILAIYTVFHLDSCSLVMDNKIQKLLAHSGECVNPRIKLFNNKKKFTAKILVKTAAFSEFCNNACASTVLPLLFFVPGSFYFQHFQFKVW